MKEQEHTLEDRLHDIGVDDALLMDGFDCCVVGVLERYGMASVVLYDKEKVLEKLVEDGCETYEDAIEYYEFNQLGGWHGELTPGFLVRLL